MSEWEEDLLALFDSLDEAARAEALAAALKIIGKQFVPLLGSHAVQQAHKLLPHRIRRRLLFPQQVGDGAAKILRQQLHFCHGRRLSLIYVRDKTGADAGFAAGHGGLDPFCAATLFDILHKKFSFHGDLVPHCNYAKLRKIGNYSKSIDNA